MEVSGRPEVVDGDTLVVGGTTVRLHGIDAAETGQRCESEGRKITRHGVAFGDSDFCLICAFSWSYDEPEILPSSSQPVGLMSADAGHL
ncbi:MAG: hypothetical protein U1F47_04360 [Hyphomicrobiales bacterium]